MKITQKKESKMALKSHSNNIIFEKIANLFELKQKGAISTEDFIHHKKRIMGLF